MNKEEFLNTVVKNCPTCGNKVRTTFKYDRDMGATLECPYIGCSYCNTYAKGYADYPKAYWPGQFEECLKDWSEL